MKKIGKLINSSIAVRLFSKIKNKILKRKKVAKKILPNDSNYFWTEYQVEEFDKEEMTKVQDKLAITKI